MLKLLEKSLAARSCAQAEPNQHLHSPQRYVYVHYTEIFYKESVILKILAKSDISILKPQYT